MEVTIISRDTIKPSPTSSSSSSSSPLHPQKPYKLCILDQLIPRTYVPMVLFYPNIIDAPTFDLRSTLSRLKKSLSQALTLYYPISGRIKNNLYIHDFDAGVPYLEVRVNRRMFEFLKLQEIELLNRLLPLQPFRNEAVFPNHDLLPLIAFQVSVFTCDRISIGISFSHKIFDGLTGDIFLNTWASFFRGDHEKISLLHPNLSQASSTFPAIDNLPQKYLAFVDNIWFQEKNYVTRRFVFNADVINTLRDKAKSEIVPKPSRVETLTCFIWEHAMAASRSHGGSSTRRASLAAHAVDLRSRMKPPMSDNAIGNIFWWATAISNPADDYVAETTDRLCDLMKLLHESVKGIDDEFLEILQGEEGTRTISEYLEQQMEVMNSLESRPEVYAFTSWSNRLSEVDFGWGGPFWIGVTGKVGPALRNLTVFVDTKRGKGIEAWITLEENHMAAMEKDANFLAFASPNPRISNM